MDIQEKYMRQAMKLAHKAADGRIIKIERDGMPIIGFPANRKTDMAGGTRIWSSQS